MAGLTKAQRKAKMAELLGAMLNGDSARAEQLDKELGGIVAAGRKRRRKSK